MPSISTLIASHLQSSSSSSAKVKQKMLSLKLCLILLCTFPIAMEDPNALAADCIVISCCCQCIILQLLIFLLLRLPCKLFYKTRDFARARIKRTRRNLGKTLAQVVENRAILKLYSLSSREGSSHGRSLRGSGGVCMEEVEKVLEDLTQKGEFVFGSFWRSPSPTPASLQAACTK